MVDLTVGMWLGDWILEDKLGEGGFAVVHRARHSTNGDVAAVKVFTHARLAERLRTERRSLGLEHAHLVKTLADGLDHDPPYLVLELMEGGDLRASVGSGAALMEHERVLEVVQAVAGALDYAHDHGVLHLDVKPENVLLDGDGVAHLADFGAVGGSDAAGVRQSLALSQELGVMGTPDYAAPEVRYGDGTVDRRADVFSLAVLSFELLTGRLPLGLDRPSQLADVPAAVDDVLAKALTRDPTGRTLSAGAFVGELRVALREPAPTASPGAVVLDSETPPPPRRRRLRKAAALSLLLAAGFVGASYSVQPRAVGLGPVESPRIRALLERAPGSRVGLLLPVEDLGARQRGWSRAGRELLDRFPEGRARVELWTPHGFASLYERTERNQLATKTGCDLFIHAVAQPGAGPLEEDAILFLVDLSNYEIRAATPVHEEAPLAVAAAIAKALAELGARGPLAVVPTVDSQLRISNRATATFDAHLTAALAAATDVALRARAGIVFRLRSADGDVKRALSASLVVSCAYDDEAGHLSFEVRSVDTSTPPGAPPVAPMVTGVFDMRFPSYDPKLEAALFSTDEEALALSRHDDDNAAVDAALVRARAHLYQQEPGAAQALIETLRARGGDAAAQLDPLLLLARAHLDRADFASALAAYDEALRLHPDSERAQTACARACFDEAKRLYDSGKGAWYINDDESQFTAARRLLDRTQTFAKVELQLRDEIKTLADLLDGEL